MATITLILDASYSMKKMPPTALFKLKELLDSIDDRDCIVDFFVFGSKVDTLSRKSFKLDESSENLDLTSKWRFDCGETALYDALLHGIDTSDKKNKKKNVIIVVTDGMDNHSSITFEFLKTKIEEYQKAGNTIILLLPDINKQFDNVVSKCIYFPYNDNNSLVQCISSGYFSQSINEAINKRQ